MTTFDDIGFTLGHGIPDDEARYVPEFATAGTASRWMSDLHATLEWSQHRIRIFGREMDAPRLSAWHGDGGCDYGYSGIRLSPQPWTPTLLEIRDRIEDASGLRYNAVLANLYRSGADSMGWHSDDEAELGPDPAIASVSLGAIRCFRMRRRKPGSASFGLDLAPGSLLLLGGTVQRTWQHALPKTRRPVGCRINLTYRQVQCDGSVACLTSDRQAAV